ncbi:hypothetical protein OAD66_05010 [Bacteroidia bacterium]|nr:hypothetical protein [Bacteroidia bacterium]MDB4107017.1 hypothetical protein [Bacteroidia bacterium]MDB9882476.1 hypothetical protein [Bacteroidia bacterium]
MPVRDWDADFLRSKRSKQDAVADDIIRNIFSSEDPAMVNSFYNTTQRTAKKLPEDLPQDVKDYFEQGDKLPVWASKSLLKRGEEFYIENGPMIAMVH